jgi:hypothetical protein
MAGILKTKLTRRAFLLQTISLIAYLLENKGVQGPHLIVAPKAVLPNWASEFKTWAPSLSAILYDGTLDTRRSIQQDPLVSSSVLVYFVNSLTLVGEYEACKSGLLSAYCILCWRVERVTARTRHLEYSFQKCFGWNRHRIAARYRAHNSRHIRIRRCEGESSPLLHCTSSISLSYIFEEAVQNNYARPYLTFRTSCLKSGRSLQLTAYNFNVLLMHYDLVMWNRPISQRDLVDWERVAISST